MPWCPKCKCEYREGIKQCAECKVDLVEELPAETDENEQMTEEYAQENAQILKELARTMQEAAEEADTSEPIRVYQDKKTRAEDFKSSAYTLLIVGVLGLVALILIELGVLPIRLAAPGKYVTYLVMGALFVIFIITGIMSFRSSKRYEQEAESEDEQTNRIKEWTIANVTKEFLHSHTQDVSELPAEVQYFHYFELLKKTITEKFGELDASYLEALCEELYAVIFEENA